MEEKFRQIKKEYDIFHRELLRKGQLPMGDTAVGFWGAAVPDGIFELFKEIKLQNFKNFIDLGSGDGRVVLIASLFTNAAGIEYDGDLHKKAAEIRDRLGLKAELMQGDFMQHDLSKQDIIFINPDKSFNKGLERKLKKELKGILIVYNVVYHPSTLKKEKIYWMRQVPATVYTLE